MSNKHKYTFFRLFHILKGLFWGFIFILGPRKNNRVIFNSSHNSAFNFNTKYLFEYFLKNKSHEYEIKYVINDDRLRKKLNEEYGSYFIHNKSLKNIIYCLMAKTWFTSSMDTPVGGFLLGLRRSVINLSHGVPIKRAGAGELNISFLKKTYYFLQQSNFTHYLVSSPATKAYYHSVYNCRPSKLVELPMPRLDVIQAKQKSNRPEEQKIKILYAPTWRHNSNVQLFPFQDLDIAYLHSFLEKNKCEILLRLHPYFEKSEETKKFLGPNIRLFGSDIASDINTALGEMDILISDYSSIFVDFLILDRPIFYFAYDLAEFSKELGFVDKYENLIAGPIINSQANFIQQLTYYLNNKDDYNELREQKLKHYFSKIDNACETCFNFIIT